jgi:hypothetical protein
MAGHNTRGLRPRSQGQYTNEAFGAGGGSAPPDDLCLNTSLCKFSLVRPRGKEGPLIFRPWGAVAYENPDLIAPGRRSPDAQGQSHWYTRCSVAKYIGIPGCGQFTFCTNYPWEKEKWHSGPYPSLFFYVKKLSEQWKKGTINENRFDVNWFRFLLDGAVGKGASMPRPNFAGFAQGIVYANGKTDYTAGKDNKGGVPLGMGPNDDLVVIELSGACGDSLMTLLDKRKKGYTGDPKVNPADAFVYGDATGTFDLPSVTLSGGLIISVFDPNHYKQITKNTSWDGTIKTGAQGYEVAFSKVWESPITKQRFGVDLDTDQTKRIFEKFQFWYDSGEPGTPDYQPGLIRVAPFEQQAEWVARGFASAGRMLELAWADKPEYLTESVMKIIRQARSVVVPGMADANGQPQQAAQQPSRRQAAVDPTQRQLPQRPATPQGQRQAPAAPPPLDNDFPDADNAAAPIDVDESFGAEQPADNGEAFDNGEAPFDNGDAQPADEQQEADPFAQEAVGEQPSEGEEQQFDEGLAEEQAGGYPEFPGGDPNAEAGGDPGVAEATDESGFPADAGDPNAGTFDEDGLLMGDPAQGTADAQQFEGEDPTQALDAAEQRLQASMAVAKQRSAPRTSAPPVNQQAPAQRAPAARQATTAPAQRTQQAPAARQAPATALAAARQAPATARQAPATAPAAAGKAGAGKPAATGGKAPVAGKPPAASGKATAAAQRAPGRAPAAKK